jgi:uncharacterized protein YcaQ
MKERKNRRNLRLVSRAEQKLRSGAGAGLAAPAETLSLSEARRIALAAQGFARPRPKGKVGIAHLRRVLHQLGMVQLDFVNVLGPAHYHVFYSRLGPYRRAHLEELVYQRREFTEQWAHEASIVPMELWPVLHHRRKVHRVRPYGFEKFLTQYPEYTAAVLAEVQARGPLLAEDLHVPDGVTRKIEGAWVTVPRATLEAHFGRGLLAIADRRPNFGRVYDLAERVIPAAHHGITMEREDAQRELLRRAACAYGVGTAADLADYYRMPVREARPRLDELVAKGELSLVRVEGWRELAYLHRAARMPESLEPRALLSPFDPVVWYRPRALRLFDFDYRMEIFVPEAKRRWGCYVLPFLLGERLVARVDLKADRSEQRLLVVAAYREHHAAYREHHAAATNVAVALAAELCTLAGWMGLDSVVVGTRGDFTRPLTAALRSKKNRDTAEI